MFAIKYRHNITHLLYSDLRELFRDELQLLTLFTLQKRALQLSGWKLNCHDRCINSCIAYTGPFQRLEACPHCKAPQHDERGQTTPYFTLPLAPQLTSMYASSGPTREAMKHNAEMLDSFDPNKIRDIHDAKAV
jgi:hypothetical protein